MRLSQLLIMMMAVLMLWAGPVRAETKIAVVNIQQLMVESVAAQDVQKQIQKQKEQLQNEFTSIEKALREKQKALADENITADQDGFAKKRAAFEEEFIAAQGKVQKSRQKLDEAAARAMNTLRGHILKSAAKIAEAEDYELVLPRTNVVLVSKELDITAPILEDLNKNVKAIKVTFEDE